VAGLRDEAARLRGREPVTLPIVGPPGTLGAMTSPDAEPGYRAMFEPGDEWVNEVIARVVLRVGLYRPATLAERIACPWLVQVMDDDAVTPAKPSVADQIAFLRRVLPPAAVPASVAS